MSTPTHCPKCGSDFKCEFLGATHYECGSTKNETGSYWESHGCLQNQLAACKAELEAKWKRNQETIEENTRLRAALAQSPGACHYCQLPKEQWSLCKSGFPGCGRADDAMGCPEFGAMMEYGALRDRCAEVIKAWRDHGLTSGFTGNAIEELATEIKYKENAK